MNKRLNDIKHYLLKLFALMVGAFLVSCNSVDINNSKEIDLLPTIFPDYIGVTIPRNIAPLSFLIKDTAEFYYAEIHGSDDGVIKLKSSNGDMKVPLNKWVKILENERNTSVAVDVYLKKNDSWIKLKRFVNPIVSDSIDSYLVYRFINPANILWHSMGIHQRNTETFEVSSIMENSITDQNCMHCHSFSANSPENFMLHMRGKPGGTLIYTKGEMKFVDTRTEYTISAGGYPAWHPDSRYIAFSTNKISQRFHAVKEKYAVVYDGKSDIILYDVEKNEISAIPQLSTVNFENMPVWSPNGEYLYFLCSKYYNADSVSYQEIKYDLNRISFNKNDASFGEVELVLSSNAIGKSVAFPRVSPDNRYVALCLADYGYFTVYNETSDIAILDLESREIIHPEINSESVESYPSWSSNGKWLLFNSKRADGISSRPYFSYFNEGVARKPFILPQESAMWNVEELRNINRPEFATSKLPLNPQEILKLVENEPIPVKFNLNSLSDTAIKVFNTASAESGEGNDFNFDQ